MKSRRLVSSIRRENEFTGAGDRRGDGSEMPNCCQNGNGWRFRYYQMGSLQVRTPVEFGPLAIGVPRCHRIDRCSTHNGILRANVRAGRSPGSPGALPIECASEGRFLEHRIGRCGTHARVSCAWKSSSQKISPGISPSPKISPEISPPCTFKKSSNFKDLRKISPISPISPPPQGYFARRLYS